MFLIKAVLRLLVIVGLLTVVPSILLFAFTGLTPFEMLGDIDEM